MLIDKSGRLAQSLSMRSAVAGVLALRGLFLIPEPYTGIHKKREKPDLPC
jgi:hypothetical protein